MEHFNFFSALTMLSAQGGLFVFVEKTDIARKCQTRKRFIRFTFIYKPEMVNAYLFDMAKRLPGNIDVHIGPA